MTTRSLTIVLLAFLAQPVLAQDPFADPMGKAPAGADPAAPANPDDPFGPGGAKPAEEKPKTDEAPRDINEPFVIQQLRDSNPATPVDLLSAAQTVFRFGRPDETKRYLAALLASNPKEEDLALLAKQIGAAFLIRISREPQVQPEGKQVADLVLAASDKLLRDPGRINSYISQLSDADLNVRMAALKRLEQSGTHIVNPMLAVMADPAREKEHRYLRWALARLAPITEGPLLGALDGAPNELRWQIMVALGRMHSRKAVTYLVRPAADPAADPKVREAAVAALTAIIGSVPDQYEAPRYLRAQINELLTGRLAYPTDEDDLVEMWTWDRDAAGVKLQKLPMADAALLVAARLSDDLYALDTQNAESVRLRLLINLELAKVLAGVEQPLPMNEGSAGDAAAKAGPAVMNQVLADALKLNRIPAAVAAAEVLGQIGDAKLLTSYGPQESPLALALIHPNRRVRLVAALAILRLKPTEAFPGSSRIVDTLAEAVRTSGTARVLVAHPRGEDAQSLVGFMNALGYEGDSAYFGKQLAEQAFFRPDYELILISDAIDRPPINELVQWLRRDYRTAQIPIGVMARGENLQALRHAFEDDPYTTVFPRLYSLESAGVEVNALLAIAGRNHVGRDERVAQAYAALDAFAALAKEPGGYTTFGVLRHEDAVISALDNPALATRAALLLGQFGTPKSQSALVEFASRHSWPLADRQAAAAAFDAAVKSRGLRLTKQQILLQYDRYNASERLDVPTQQLLGAIIDAIEAPAIARGELTQVE